MVKELIRGFLSGDWIERLDFSTLEKIGNTFVSDDLRERHSDVIWRLRLKGEEADWVYLYLLLEFQSTSDPFMAVRLLTYVGLLLEDVIRKERLKPGDRLPAVLPVVLHNAKSRWRAPLRLETLFIPVPKPLKQYLPRLTYLLLDERRLDLDRPELKRNPTAALFRFETNETLEALPGLYQTLNDLLPRQESALRRTVQGWVTAVVRRRVPGAIIPEGVSFTEVSMFEETMIKWRNQVLREADERNRRGLREARQEGMQTLILQQMTQRFGRLPARVRRQVEAISSIQELRKLGRRVLRAKSLAEMGLE
jgi:Putative transposase, YhgA-like/Domain of unknown function (DUF4351)